MVPRQLLRQDFLNNFVGKGGFIRSFLAHKNYLATDSTRGPLAVSVINDGTHYKTLVRSNLGCDRLTVPISKVKSGTIQKAFKREPKLSQIVSAMG